MSDETMRAMVLDEQGGELRFHDDWPVPQPRQGQVRLRVRACGICRTDLHVLDGDLDEPKLPLILGHQIVGTVESLGAGVSGLSAGDRIGVPWLGSSCGRCRFCREGRENLCDHAQYTGYQIDGGFADYAVADARFCFPIPDGFDDLQAAPLLCAGLIGYRAYRFACDELPDGGGRLGLYGFGSAAHILAQVAGADGHDCYAFVRPGDEQAKRFASSLGCVWAGDSDDRPDEPLDAAILFAPVGSLVPTALQAVRKGGVVVCAGIHMSDIPSMPYRILWEERVVRSVANLTRADGEQFLQRAPEVPVKTTVTAYPLKQAGEALADLREGAFDGSGVIVLEDNDLDVD